MRGLRRILPPAIRRPTRKRPVVVVAIAAGAALVTATAGLAGWVLLRDTGRAESHPRLSEPPRPVEPVALVAPAPRPTQPVSFSEGCVSPECHANLAPAPGVHAPVADHACDTCHQPDAGNHVYPLVGSPRTLCDDCHDTGADRLVQHKALTEAGCLACHSPHVSTGPFLLTARTVTQTCTQCHPLAEGASRHDPYDNGDCVVCHEPHASDVPDLLRGGAGSTHCRLCHEQTIEVIQAAPYAHHNLERPCLACHGAHATPFRPLLTDEPGNQCLACHDDVRRAVVEAVVTHDAVLTGEHCVTCHAPHAANNPIMLRANQVDLCLECHDEPLTATGGRTIPDMSDAILHSTFTHGPVKSSECSACHAVHGARFERLLRAINPAVLTGAFELSNYTLCFSCHDQSLVLEERTRSATQFRDGDRNLHHLHLTMSNRARGCADCHAVHGSSGPRLIAEAVPYQGSDWMMKIGFELTDHGGGCSPGCHEPLRYNRADPVNAPPAPEGGAP